MAGYTNVLCYKRVHLGRPQPSVTDNGPMFALKKIYKLRRHGHWWVPVQQSSVLTSWYLETPPFTAASMTPLRHMVKGLIFCICLVWHWLIRVFSCWFLFSNTSMAFSRGLISTWKANEYKCLPTFMTFKTKDAEGLGAQDRQSRLSTLWIIYQYLFRELSHSKERMWKSSYPFIVRCENIR